MYDKAILGVIATPDGLIPGDANGDGVVDVADLGVLGGNFGAAETVHEEGDFNGDDYG